MLASWKQKHEGKMQPELQMPDELIEILVKANRFTFGPLFQLDQRHHAYFDMTIHQLCSDKEAESVDLAVLWSKSRREIGLIDGQGIFDGHYAEGHGYSTFSHLMITDYTVGYYAYL